MSKITYITIGSKTYELHDPNALLSSDIASWAKQPNKPSYTASEVGAIATSAKGAANGVAPLNSSSKIDSTYLPSYVDDVLEYTSKSDFPATGEAGKIYVDKTTNLTYRWGGSSYVEISPSLALGETSSTAYRGDRGKIAYDHAAAKGSAFASGLYKITTNSEGHVTAATAVAKSDITALGIPAQDTTYSSKSAASGGTDVSLVTTGEKYTWNSKTSNTGTVTSVTMKAGSGISLDSESAITTSGTRTISHADTSSQASSSNSGRTYIQSVTLDTYGHVTGLSTATETVTDTWRGIQDNLTSSTNTTESLSAKQGYLLANGSARDNTKLPLTGGTVTGVVTFDSSVSIDEATVGDLVITGAASCTNNLQVNTINGVAVGSSPKFTDNDTTYSAGSGLSLNDTTFNHSNSVTAQTTQAVYPIKIDAQGHISGYGSAVTIVNTRGTATSGGTTLSVVNTGDMYTWNNKVSKSPKTASLTVAGWSNNTQIVSVSGVTSSNDIIISPAISSIDAYSGAGIKCTAQGSGTLTFTCESVPSAAISVNVLILN